MGKQLALRTGLAGSGLLNGRNISIRSRGVRQSKRVKQPPHSGARPTVKAPLLRSMAGTGDRPTVRSSMGAGTQGCDGLGKLLQRDVDVFLGVRGRNGTLLGRDGDEEDPPLEKRTPQAH